MAAPCTKAVKIASNGEFVFPRPQSTLLDVPLDHAIFEVGEPVPMSELVGIPMLITTFRPSLVKKTYRDKVPEDRYSSAAVDKFCENTTAARLIVSCTLGERTPLLFTNSLRWQQKVGTALVARVDKMPLYPHHIAAMQSFVAKVDGYDREKMTAAAVAQGKKVTEQDVLDRITPEAFQAYYTDLRSTWLAEGADPEEVEWSKEPSPFVDATPPSTQSQDVPEVLDEANDEEVQTSYSLKTGQVLGEAVPRSIVNERLDQLEMNVMEYQAAIAQKWAEMSVDDGHHVKAKALPPHLRRKVESV